MINDRRGLLYCILMILRFQLIIEGSIIKARTNSGGPSDHFSL